MKHDAPAVGLWMVSWNTTSLPYGPFFDTKEEAMRYGVDELDDARWVSRVASVSNEDDVIVAAAIVKVDLNDLRLTTSDHDAPDKERGRLWRGIVDAVADVLRRHKCLRPGFTIAESTRFVAAGDTSMEPGP